MPIGAAAGVHEAAFRLLSRYVSPPARVLDVGTGAGAFLQRLTDGRYAAEGVDLRRDGFAADGLVRQHDLNKAFPEDWGPYDAVTAVEVIEHLENPRHFFRECTRIVVSCGFLLLTTPHIESGYSRLKFLASGRFEWFEESHYESSGHITPLTQWQLQRIAQETGFRIVAREPGPRTAASLRRRFVAVVLAWLMRDVGWDDVRVLLLQKTAGCSG